jgi:hypothetical protein
MIFQILLLIGLTRLLSVTDKPLLCSGIYTGVSIIFALFGEPISFFSLLIGLGIVFALSSLYFWLLNYFAENLFLYFVVLIGGLFIGFI